MLGLERISQLTLPPLPPQAQAGATVNRAAETRVRDVAKEFETTFLGMGKYSLIAGSDGSALAIRDLGEAHVVARHGRRLSLDDRGGSLRLSNREIDPG